MTSIIGHPISQYPQVECIIFGAFISLVLAYASPQVEAALFYIPVIFNSNKAIADYELEDFTDSQLSARAISG